MVLAPPPAGLQAWLLLTMSVAEETFNPAALSRSDTFSSVIVSAKTLPPISTKPVRSTLSQPRIDFEPLYADLKAAVGHNWGTYYDALTRFIRGEGDTGSIFWRLTNANAQASCP